jgi:hypothetical protein
MANLPALTPTNFAEAMQFAEALAKSTMVPREFQRNPANILLAVQWGAELGMPPLQALQSIAVINGKPAVYGDAMLALVRGSPLCEDVIERVEGQGDNAKRAGLWGKAGPWTQYPTRMLQMRARGFALRDAFPDVLRGVISAEEAADAPRVAKDVTPPQDVATDLDAFAEGKPEVPIAQQEDIDTDESDDLLALARAVTLTGYKDFHKWYTTEIDDDQRTYLRPHIKGLAQAAREADEELGDHAGSEDDAPAPAVAAEPHPGVAPPDRPREAGEEEQPAAPEGGDDVIPLILPARLRRGWDWPGYANELIEAAHRLPPEQLGEFRALNASQMNNLRISHKEEWSRVQQTLAEHEREGEQG